MMLESRSTTDGMMPARSGASTVDGRDGHIPMEGIAISMLIIGDMSTALVCICMVAITLRRMLVTYVCTYILKVCIVATN